MPHSELGLWVGHDDGEVRPEGGGDGDGCHGHALQPHPLGLGFSRNLHSYMCMYVHTYFALKPIKISCTCINRHKEVLTSCYLAILLPVAKFRCV